MRKSCVASVYGSGENGEDGSPRNNDYDNNNIKLCDYCNSIRQSVYRVSAGVRFTCNARYTSANVRAAPYTRFVITYYDSTLVVVVVERFYFSDHLTRATAKLSPIRLRLIIISQSTRAAAKTLLLQRTVAFASRRRGVRQFAAVVPRRCRDYRFPRADIRSQLSRSELVRRVETVCTR